MSEAPIRLSIPRGTAPRALTTPSFSLRAQTLEHNDADYAAVMASREHLRNWSQSEWPEDAFSLEANRSDLCEHIGDAERGEAFGFTVFAPDETTVLGSLYFSPAAWLTDRYDLPEAVRTAWAAAGVAPDYWLRPEVEAEMDRHQNFLTTVHRWAGDAWGWNELWWSWRGNLPAREQVFQRLPAERIGAFPSLSETGLQRTIFRTGPGPQ